MIIRNINLYFLTIFSCFLFKCDRTVPDRFESKSISLIFETDFEYIFEDPQNVNFSKVSNLNGVSDAQLEAQIWKQDLSVIDNPQSYLAALLKQGLKLDSTIKYKIKPDWVVSGQTNLETLFTTVDTSINIAETSTIHRRLRLWTNYKIKQRWFYDEISKSLSNKVISVNPIFILKKEIIEPHYLSDTTIWYTEERIEIPMNKNVTPNSTIKELLNNQNIVWLKQTKTDIRFKNIMMIKGNTTKLKQIFWDDIIYFNKLAYNRSSYGMNERTIAKSHFDTSNLKVIMRNSSIDTITRFHPETYNEYVIIAKYIPPTFESIKAYSIDQIWYFNNQSKQLESKLLHIGPLIRNHFDNKLQELYFIPQN